MTCSEQVLCLTTDGPVAVIRFSQPSNVNVITLRWAEEMQVALENVSRNANVRAVMLCGAGRGFLAGGDLAYLHRTPPEIAAREADTLILQLNRVIESIVALPIPTLASVHGATAGAGISLLLACDYAIAAADARFVFAYSQIAATPDGVRTSDLQNAVEAFFNRNKCVSSES